jgi:hypothetical protein
MSPGAMIRLYAVDEEPKIRKVLGCAQRYYLRSIYRSEREPDQLLMRWGGLISLSLIIGGPLRYF